MKSKSDIAIKVDNVSKTFKLPHEKSTSLKGAVLNKVKQKKGYEVQEALKDISFEVKKGEFFGIVGRNGSGKSTLLKCMAGVYTPNKGKIHINGKLVPFIELGVGFNPELSGRDNVFLNGALLGFSRKQMEEMYDEIVEFAELEAFMDQKLKNYSSGMQVRLAFSIAIRAKGDILLLDEVLAVGDTAFQQKCYDYFEKLKAEGHTVVLVTHDMGAVERFCTRALLLNQGEIIEIGNTSLVTDKYTKLNLESIKKEISRNNIFSSDDIQVTICDSSGEQKKVFETSEHLDLIIEWKNEKVRNIGVAFMKQSGERMFATNTFKDEHKITGNKCVYKIKLDVTQGKYFFRIRAFSNSPNETVSILEKTETILIIPVNKKPTDGLVALEHSWINLK